MPNPPLTVYKASAGSGKTFTLAVEYIKLLIEDPASYRHILAVTFTNKATEEMKMRILSQLNGLANGYEDSNDYLKKICKELGCDEYFVRARAQQALTAIIHHYHYFRVETIDKFFQRVLRNLARELDLTANLRIELNDNLVEQQAVDMMINQLKSDDPVMKWLVRYIQDNVSSDKTWNVIGDVKTFGENIFNDKYKQHHKDMKDIMSKEHFFEDFIGQLYAFKEQCIQDVKAYAQQFFDTIQGYTIDDFNQKSRGAYGYFEALLKGNVFREPSDTVLKYMNDPNYWGHSKSLNYSAINDLAKSTLVENLKAADQARRHNVVLINTTDLVLRNLNQLRLLISIEKKVREINQEANRFLLSDTQGLLHDLIGDSDTPFIFEKTGAILRHIMIDEFQDTGRVQWQNFKILLRDCMDQHTGNLIVGDVKQSIYRWRSGDWRLLNGIEQQFDEKQLLVKDLKTNYRSSRHVITFNNVFFQTAAKKEYERLLKFVGDKATELKTAYKDVVQEIPEKSFDGYVRVELFSKVAPQSGEALQSDVSSASQTSNLKSPVMERISQVIHSLIDHGVEQSKIAILARNKKDISNTTMYFQEHEPDIHIVSDEAFQLDSSITLDILIASLRVLSNPGDLLSKTTLVKNYQNVVMGSDINDAQLSQLHDKGIEILDAWLPETFVGESNRHRLLSLPLNELIETLYDMFGLDRLESQAAYVCAFYDQLNTFLSDNVGDVETFLSEWDTNMFKKSIQGAQVDGIRMVTIHKSKGLEFDHVILPFCDWRLEQKKGVIVWFDCEDKGAPFNQLPILPINYSKAVADTLYADDYKYEHLQNSVDNLNLLYVAFTRAKNSLFVMGEQKVPDDKDKKNPDDKDMKIPEEKDKKENEQESEKLVHEYRDELIKQCLPEVNRLLPGSTYQTLDDGTIILEYGSLDSINVLEKKEKKSTRNVFLQREQEQTFTIKSHQSHAQFLQSNASKAFTSAASDEDHRYHTEYIVRGTLLHSIFSRLHDIHDIHRVLQQLTMEGVLYDEISPDELQPMLRQALSDDQVREWFSPRWEVHNECAILYRDPESNTVVERRPDRVISDDNEIIVIDFKFGKPHKDHHTQVQLYMEKLHQMDTRPVKGYLWYVTQQMVIEVTEKL